MEQKVSKEFMQYWNQARQNEEEGHRFFQQAKYSMAGDKHKKAASLFKKSIDYIDEKDEEIRKKTLGNHYIELANYYHSIATYFFYKGEKEKSLANYQSAIEEQKKSIEIYETLKNYKNYKNEINTLKVSLHFYLAYENLCSAQIAFLNGGYSKAIEYFKIAEIHNNLELEFLSEIGDTERSKRAKARFYYIKGQIFRLEALIAMQEANKDAARENYLKASFAFEEAFKTYPEWKEYKELVEKTKKMALAIKKN